MFAQQVRIDPQDNVWVVDQMTGYVMKLDSGGHVQMLLGRKPEAIPVPAPVARGDAGAGGGGGRGRGGLPGAGAQSDVFNRPTDVAWDAAGNIFVADGMGNARVAKFDSKGVFIKSWGSRGAEPGMFASVTALVVDAQGNVYAADGGNKRIQVFDNNGTFKTQFGNVGAPAAMCITPGPNQVLYVSNSNPPEDFDSGGEIYKVKLDGTVVGKFGRAGKRPKEFGAVNSLDCRTENTLLVGEAANMRVQRLTLR
jgi:DNA-binding beta-propeller fold protein YncE